MAIIGFDKDTLIDYAPSYGGNRDSETPCIVRMRFIPYSRVQHYSRVLAGRTKGMTDPTKLANVSQDIQKKQFTDSVESISGYTIGGREVTDPDEFYETADTDLIIEIIRAMESQQRLTEGQVKNS